MSNTNNSNSNSNSIYIKALKVAPETAAHTVITAGKITQSALSIAESTAKATENLVGSAKDITASIKGHTKRLANSGLNVAQYGFNTVKSVTKGISNTAESIAIQAEKRKMISRIRASAIEGTAEQRKENEEKKIIYLLELNQRKRELNARKKELSNKIKKQENNYYEKSTAQKHNLKMLKLGNKSKNDLGKFYKGQIGIVQDISKGINISLEQVRQNICAGKYFSLSLSCKRIKNFNGNGFRVKIARIKELYQIYCENIVKKLETKLKLSIVSVRLDIFSTEYIQQVEILTNINNKLLDYINEIMRTTTRNTITEYNKKNINIAINELEKLIMKNKSQSGYYENQSTKIIPNRENNNKFGNLSNNPNNQSYNLSGQYQTNLYTFTPNTQIKSS